MRRRPSGRSAARRSAPRRSPIADRRSATGSPTATRASATSPTTSPGSAPTSRPYEEWISGYDLARDADLLIHDCQYTDEEYPGHEGWGHSPITETLTFASRVGARRTLLFHHDPLHTDGFLDDLHRSARRCWEDLGGNPEQIGIAAERAELTVEGQPSAARAQARIAV